MRVSNQLEKQFKHNNLLMKPINPVNGLKTNRLNTDVRVNSTWMTDSRPGDKTPSVKFSVESEFQI